MKKIASDLKRAMAGLTYQNAGDFLSRREKLRCLDEQAAAQSPYMYTTYPYVGSGVTGKKKTKKIALLAYKKVSQEVLAYAVEQSRRLDAQLDLLVCCEVKGRVRKELEAQLRSERITYQLVTIMGSINDALEDYINKHPSLAFVVVQKGKAGVEHLIETIESVNDGKLPVPVVLIDERVVGGQLVNAPAV